MEGYTEIEKHKSPEAKGSRNNLRKGWAFIFKNKSLCVRFIWELGGGTPKKPKE